VSVLAALVDELRDGNRISGVGISIGGNVAGERLVTRAPFLGWRDIVLADLVEAAVGVPVTVENDVTALTTAEQWFGEVRGRPSFAVVTIGAGVGYGLVMHDRVVTTPDSGLGLGGHLPLDPNGPMCMDGHPGCAVAMLSIPSISAQLGIALGREVEYEEVLDAAAEGHPLAVAITTAAGRALGRMMATIANIAMVDTIVLSGEGIALWNIVGDVAMAALAADRDPEASPVEVHVDDAGFDSWARGAAAVAIQAALGRLRLPA
jgi:predicted NBD/HSP70 family sugar kinase